MIKLNGNTKVKHSERNDLSINESSTSMSFNKVKRTKTNRRRRSSVAEAGQGRSKAIRYSELIRLHRPYPSTVRTQ